MDYDQPPMPSNVSYFKTPAEKEKTRQRSYNELGKNGDGSGAITRVMIPGPEGGPNLMRKVVSLYDRERVVTVRPEGWDGMDFAEAERVWKRGRENKEKGSLGSASLDRYYVDPYGGEALHTKLTEDEVVGFHSDISYLIQKTRGVTLGRSTSEPEHLSRREDRDPAETERAQVLDRLRDNSTRDASSRRVLSEVSGEPTWDGFLETVPWEDPLFFVPPRHRTTYRRIRSASDVCVFYLQPMLLQGYADRRCLSLDTLEKEMWEFGLPLRGHSFVAESNVHAFVQRMNRGERVMMACSTFRLGEEGVLAGKKPLDMSEDAIDYRNADNLKRCMDLKIVCCKRFDAQDEKALQDFRSRMQAGSVDMQSAVAAFAPSGRLCNTARTWRMKGYFFVFKI